MKNILFTIFRILIGVVLLGHVLDWFLDFDDTINKILNAAMFSLIGIAYLVVGTAWDNKLIKAIIIACGLFLVAMNFAKSSTPLNIVGILCILTPLLIARFSKESNDKMNILRN